jgi:hypothetical protein
VYAQPVLPRAAIPLVLLVCWKGDEGMHKIAARFDAIAGVRPHMRPFNFKQKPPLTPAEFSAALEAGFGVERARIVDVSGRCPGFPPSEGEA